MDTESLVKKAKKGDKNALVKLIMDKKQDYYKIAYVYMKNSEDTMDAMEDMIVVLYQNIHKLKKEKAFYSWSKKILVNCCKNLLRKNNKVVLLENTKEEAYEENFHSKETGIILEEHLSKLNEKHREVIKLRYYLDMDYKTISQVLKIPTGTVKSRISNGLKKLKVSLGGENL
ncbi:RNA polymerase sigma factor [Tepidibacter hydrothermalis]|uniref:Sigma-70 family RNA polymerase sigma factor n=1 Tax=Tepidibacter hydrothermalis TaxID=3036126 RepID=A0ABY8EDA2_9FIRM|nr:sigma-70 family RNA polymerase sigma factor [Tepidibacter hydrothermalis]WFD10913.1 sigma-70 family RNA polymerase sigma factor [Tepidibacter hydrothermalis]